MSQGLEVDVKQIVVSSGSFGPQEIDQLIASIRDDQANYRTLREAAGELEDREDTSPAAAVRLGVCYFLLGRYRKAVEVLRKADDVLLATAETTIACIDGDGKIIAIPDYIRGTA